jgi:hypothetical protein
MRLEGLRRHGASVALLTVWTLCLALVRPSSARAESGSRVWRRANVAWMSPAPRLRAYRREVPRPRRSAALPKNEQVPRPAETACGGEPCTPPEQCIRYAGVAGPSDQGEPVP